MQSQPPSHDLLRSFLAGRYASCPVCRYNLRDCAGTRCPECGVRLDLRVGSIDMRLGPFLTCVLALAIPLGHVGIMSVLATVFLPSAYGAREWLIAIVFWSLTVIYALALVLVIRRRSLLHRLPVNLQWRVAVFLAVVMAAVQVVSLTFLLRLP